MPVVGGGAVHELGLRGGRQSLVPLIVGRAALGLRRGV
jgi:hypothetical protein